jgi:hypothetical protein
MKTRAGNEARLATGQKQCRPRHVLRQTEPADRCFLFPERTELRVFQEGFAQPGD